MNETKTANPVALIFDMDGVLIDSEPLHERAKREALQEAGIAVPDSLFAAYIGRSDAVMMEDLAAEHGLDAAQSTAILRSKLAIYESLEHTMQPIAGAVEFLLWACTRYRLAVATSATSRNRAVTLEQLGVAALFETAVDAASFQHPKPSPEVFNIALERLALRPENCWILEDSVNGILAAKAAGCYAVGLTTSFSRQALLEAGADFIVTDFAQLQTRLEQLQG
ncbi:MAG: HAD family hydrolase [Janthinobacterium lividum]